MIDDPGLLGEKYWAFPYLAANPTLVTNYQGRSPVGGTNCSSTPASTAMTQNAFTWTQDSAGNFYIGEVDTTADVGQSYAVTKKTTQTVDVHGNVTQVNNYNYPGFSPSVRTYNYSYLNEGSYTSRYIFNRLTSATVTDGTNNLTLASIAYDGSGLTGSATPREWDSSYGSVTTRGNATSITDVSGNRTSVSYDKYGNTVITTVNGVPSSASVSGTTNYAAPDSITVNSALTTSMTYSSFLGLTNETGPNGTSVDIGYDSAARPVSSTSPFGATTGTAYNDTASPPNTCTSVNGRWTQTQLDGLGRPHVVLTGYGSPCGSGTILSQAETNYESCGCSPLGKMYQQEVPHVPNAEHVATTTYSYDGIGRTLAVVTGGSDTTGTTYYSYAANTAQATDPAGSWKNFTMDAFGNLYRVMEPNPAGGSNYFTYLHLRFVEPSYGRIDDAVDGHADAQLRLQRKFPDERDQCGERHGALHLQRLRQGRHADRREGPGRGLYLRFLRPVGGGAAVPLGDQRRRGHLPARSLLSRRQQPV